MVNGYRQLPSKASSKLLQIDHVISKSNERKLSCPSYHCHGQDRHPTVGFKLPLYRKHQNHSDRFRHWRNWISISLNGNSTSAQKIRQETSRDILVRWWFFPTNSDKYFEVNIVHPVLCTTLFLVAICSNLRKVKLVCSWY